jgi:peptidoglycan/LPS O-acetylase OafA/YrhL
MQAPFQSNLSAKRILGFNGIRGLCVILVFLWHKCGIQFHFAEIGVWTFLALSGFLLIPELGAQRRMVESGKSTRLREAGTFWFKRATRIFPVYYALILFLYAVSGYLAWAGSDLGFRYHVVFLSNYFFALVAPQDTLNGPFGVLWTLAVEQQFYLFAPAIFLLLPSRHHIAFCGIAAVCCGIGHIWLTLSGAAPIVIYMLSPWNFAIVLLGGLTGLVCRQRQSSAGSSVPFLALSVLGIAAFSASSLIEWATEGLVYAILTVGVTFAIVGLLAAVHRGQEMFFTRVLGLPPLELLGQISYGFYLFHNFIPNPLGKAFLILFGSLPSNGLKVTVGAALAFAIATSLAYLSWTYFEKPIIQLRARLLRPELKMGGWDRSVVDGRRPLCDCSRHADRNRACVPGAGTHHEVLRRQAASRG